MRCSYCKRSDLKPIRKFRGAVLCPDHYPGHTAVGRAVGRPLASVHGWLAPLVALFNKHKALPPKVLGEAP
jgi:hypothetical protein